MSIRSVAIWALLLLLSSMTACTQQADPPAAQAPAPPPAQGDATAMPAAGGRTPTQPAPSAPSPEAPSLGKKWALPGNRAIATSFEQWLLPSKGQAQADDDLVNDVKLTRLDPSLGVQLVKTSKSGNIWVFPGESLEGDGTHRLLVTLPAIQELMAAGPPGGMVSIGYWPEERNLPIPLGPSPPPFPTGRNEVTIELQRMKDVLTVQANGRPLAPPAKITGPVRLGLLMHGDIFLWLRDATIDNSRPSGTPPPADQVASSSTENRPANARPQPQDPSTAPAAKPDEKKDELIGEPVQEIRLPSPADEAVPAASGRLLVLRLPAIRQLAVVDLIKGELKKLVSCDDPEALIAAGAESLVIYHRATNRLERWNLESLEMEQAEELSLEFEINEIAMGVASHGPLMLAGGKSRDQCGVKFIDVPTLKPRQIKIRGDANMVIRWNELHHLRASSDGQSFGFYCEGGRLLTLAGDSAEVAQERNLKAPVPDSRGEIIYTDQGRRTRQFQPLSEGEPGPARAALPATAGGLFASVMVSRDQYSHGLEQGAVSLHLPEHPVPLAQFKDLSIRVTAYEIFDRGKPMPGDRRVVFHEPSGTLAVVPVSNDRVQIKRVDIDQLLADADTDYIYVASAPPRLVKPGQTVKYTVESRQKHGPPSFELMASPDGLTLNDAGELQWTVPESTAPGDQESVIVMLKDTEGHAIYHTFTLAVAAEPGAIPDSVAEARGQDGGTYSARVQKNVVSLPAPFHDVQLAGGGRYLLLYLKSLRKIAQFDVEKGEIERYFDLDSDEVLLAGGKTRMVVVDPENRTIDRWNLLTGKREQRQDLKTEHKPTLIAMGHDSEGPIYVATDSDFRKNEAGFLKLSSLRPQGLLWNPNQHYLELGRQASVRVSANGRLFAGWRNHVSPSGIIVIEVLGNRADSRYEHTTAGYVVPSPDGMRLFTASGIFTNQIKPLEETSKPTAKQRFLKVPAVSGDYYVALPVLDPPTSNTADKEPYLNVFVGDDREPLITLRDFGFRGGAYSDNFSREMVTLDKRLLLCPQFDTLVVLPESNNSVVLMKLDLEGVLAKGDRDVLLIISNAPSSVKPGEDLAYQMVVKSKHTKLKYRLASGPEGMAVSDSGRVTWKAPAGDAGKEHSVILAVAGPDGTGERFQTFALRVESATSDAADVAATTDEPPAAEPSTDTPPTPAPTPASPQLPKELRVWTDATGQFQVRATVAQVLEGKVRLRRPDGTEIQVETARLSEADQQYLRELEERLNKEAPSPKP